MINPLAGPWSVRRNRQRGRRRQAGGLSFSGDRYPMRRKLEGDQSPGLDLEMIARANARYGVVGASIAGASGAVSTATLATATAPAQATAPAPAAPTPTTVLPTTVLPTTVLPTTVLPTTAPPVASKAPAVSTVPGATGEQAAPSRYHPDRTRQAAGAPAADKRRPAKGLRSLLDRGDKPRWRKSARKPSSPNSRRPARQRRYSAKVAIPVLLGLVVVATVLVGVIVKLAGLGLTTAAGSTNLTVPLANPAPAFAAGLPEHEDSQINPTTIALIDAFTQRFAAVSGSYSGQPSGFYREPGAIDPQTGQPGWVMYLGYNASSDLGSPAAAVSKLMASLIKTTAPNASWAASPGQLGGAARCANATVRGTAVTFCAWATERTYGALMSPTSAVGGGKELAALMPQMRLDLQS